jgi:hypothetical protein
MYFLFRTTINVCDAMPTVAPVEAGSHVGCQRQLPGTVEAADRDCAADGERVAADIEAEDYHRRSTRKYVQ